MEGIYLQPVYVYYPGNGTERYFTAKDDAAAKEFLENEVFFDGTIANEGGSVFGTPLLIQATRPYWLKHGIANDKNILS